MRTKFVCILALVLTLSLSAAAVQRLTKGGIAKMVDKMTRAAQERNVEQLMKHFAPEAVITLHTEGRKLVMSPDEYRANLVKGWKRAPQSTLEVKDLFIRVSPNGKRATASDTSIETIILGGQKYIGETEEKIEIELINGLPKITKLDGTLTIKK